MQKLCEQVKDHIVWKHVEDTAQGLGLLYNGNKF